MCLVCQNNAQRLRGAQFIRVNEHRIRCCNANMACELYFGTGFRGIGAPQFGSLENRIPKPSALFILTLHPQIAKLSVIREPSFLAIQFSDKLFRQFEIIHDDAGIANDELCRSLAAEIGRLEVMYMTADDTRPPDTRARGRMGPPPGFQCPSG